MFLGERKGSIQDKMQMQTMCAGATTTLYEKL